MSQIGKAHIYIYIQAKLDREACGGAWSYEIYDAMSSMSLLSRDTSCWYIVPAVSGSSCSSVHSSIATGLTSARRTSQNILHHQSDRRIHTHHTNTARVKATTTILLLTPAIATCVATFAGATAQVSDDRPHAEKWAADDGAAGFSEVGTGVWASSWFEGGCRWLRWLNWRRLCSDDTDFLLCW